MTAIIPRSLLPRRPIRPEQLPLRPPVDRRACVNKCFSEAGGDGAGLPSTSKRRASVKKRMAGIVAKTRQFAQIALSKSCGALAYSDPLDAGRGSALLLTFRA